MAPTSRKRNGNKYKDDYRVKLDRIAADIEAGAIDRLTLKIGRERYNMRDTRTLQAQIDLAWRGLLVRQGRRYQVVIAA